MAPPTGSLPEQDRAPWTSPLFLLSAAFIALILVLGIVVVLDGGDGDEPPSAASPPTSASASSPGVIPSESLDTRVPTSSPSGVTWQVWNTVALPFSRGAGPARVDGDVATGFAHTPVGALLASEQIVLRATISNQWKAIATANLAPGEGLAIWKANREKYGDFAPPSPGKLCQIAGFKFVTYTPATAVVQTASRCPNGSLQVTISTVEWAGSDWKLVLQPNGDYSPSVQVISSLEYFIAWGGV